MVVRVINTQPLTCAHNGLNSGDIHMLHVLQPPVLRMCCWIHFKYFATSVNTVYTWVSPISASSRCFEKDTTPRMSQTSLKEKNKPPPLSPFAAPIPSRLPAQNMLDVSLDPIPSRLLWMQVMASTTGMRASRNVSEGWSVSSIPNPTTVPQEPTISF
uniref:Uncharacterized protein n=1 Tax=Anopheles culicifacies TaxID=139723 RepID=A0A182MVP1_9DIPT